MTRRLVALPLAAGEPALAALPALRAALDGSGPAVLPHPAGGPSPRHGEPMPLPTYDEAQLPDDLAVVVGTSGSTGPPKLALLSAAALAASAAATADRLGGVGDWLLALPPNHIAGLQVLLRALAWDTQVAVLPPGPFRAQTFAEVTAARQGRRRGHPTYVSLVPTQLARLLPDARGRAALATYAAVLLGGAPCPPDLLDRARAAGVAVVTTYGASETAGGCVYDGITLTCTDVDIEAPDATGTGRILLGGATLASGYLGDPNRTAAAFPHIAGRRRYRTDDLGRLEPGPSGAGSRLVVLGRADDVIVTGGYKVLPPAVEEAVAAALPGWQALVVGVPDPDWGQVVAVALAPSGAKTPLGATDSPPAAPSLAALRDVLRGALPAYALPRRLLVLPALPILGIGKPDRAAVRRRFAARA